MTAASTTAGGLIGLSTYAYFWRFSDRVARPMSLDDMLRDASELGAEVFQICDYAPLDDYSDERLAGARSLAESHGLTLEVGTRGTDPAHLLRYLEIAVALGATLVRSMWSQGSDNPSASENVTRLGTVLPRYEEAGVTLALETYEQVSSVDLVALVEVIGSPNLGICLDPANTVANLELPGDVTGRCLPHIVNWHVKDFDFSREAGWVGFSLLGAPLGAGRLDYDGMRRAIDPARRGISQIIEHWLPWQGDGETTTRVEAEWTKNNLNYLKENNS
ncbi:MULTISPECIES: sugar phosphate isomerase/epimerase [unclassified Frondihabitans]|uniref:sugar phosphate isomerase/epimerase family protein n=1 Tax=unclassified Frondihabitans TaxID=2626248 RepID=UPI000F4F4E18|nr:MULTISPECIES: sugar phosphate isomerase/epimerase family protein [unclassified Frondihabitans]RPE76366.1 sugar phosphate isomerase/epimerase [Frondihabitans sp. PhB153]RPF05358.1 sugar phosphate isomerase/epimerase [Frondihabitans sp. PhB161]